MFGARCISILVNFPLCFGFVQSNTSGNMLPWVHSESMKGTSKCGRSAQTKPEPIDHQMYPRGFSFYLLLSLFFIFFLNHWANLSTTRSDTIGHTSCSLLFFLLFFLCNFFFLICGYFLFVAGLFSRTKRSNTNWFYLDNRRIGGIRIGNTLY